MEALPESGGSVDIAWEQARDANRANWDDRAAIHATAYDIDRFVADPAYLSDVVRDDWAVLSQHLPASGLTGLDVVHLQCHIGTDTISLARLGAGSVTGLDYSPASLEVARGLTERLGAQVTWVESDVMTARAAITTDADVVYTGVGAICWLQDLTTWAKQIFELLRPGGVFYIRDGHPVLNCLDETRDELVLRYGYFGDGKAQAWDSETSYTGEGTVDHPRTYEWPHPISEIIGALLGAGLVLERFDEGQALPWQFAPRMEPTGDGSYLWPEDERNIVPCTYTIVARKPPEPVTTPLG